MSTQLEGEQPSGARRTSPSLAALLRPYRLLVAGALLFGSVAGSSAAAFVGLINESIAKDVVGVHDAIPLIALLAASVLFRFVAAYFAASASSRLVANARTELVRRALRTPLSALERVGQPAFTTVLSEDLPQVGSFINALVGGVMSSLGIVVALAYLASESLALFGLAVPLLLIGGLGAGRLFGGLNRKYEARRARVAEVHHGSSRLVFGAKELRLNARRRQAFLHGDVEVAIDRIRSIEVAVSFAGSFATGWTRLVLFVSIAAFAVVGRYWLGATSTQVASFTITSFYVASALEGVMQIMPMMAAARVALGQIEVLRGRLPPAMEREVQFAEPLLENWSGIELSEVVYRYTTDAEQPFVLGPISLFVPRGKIVFVVGGNGSGKSTLAKLMAGLYAPDTGDVSLGVVEVTGDNRDWYRQHFSSVFFDFHLFERITTDVSPETLEKAHEYLRLLRLDHKVTIVDGRFSTTKLSQGQSKRLALLVAYLEDRPIYVFDEWAADQDPGFKAVFYRRLLPELRSRGKTVIAVSHDERYFDVADALIKVEDGRLAEDGTAQFMSRLTRA